MGDPDLFEIFVMVAIGLSVIFFLVPLVPIAEDFIPGSSWDSQRLGIFFGWDAHGSIIRDESLFMEVAFGDDPEVMSDALIWFSTLWHLDEQGGINQVDEILSLADGTNKRIWLNACFDFSNPDEWSRYEELIDSIKNHRSLYAVGISTDEWSRYPSTDEECKAQFTAFRDMVRSKGKKAFAHLFFAADQRQGPMPEGVPWFCANYDLVILHNNYPHYDTCGASPGGVLHWMLNMYADEGPGLVGGSQGYFGATGGIYRCGTDTQSDYWIEQDFVNVIDYFGPDRIEYPETARILFLAIHYPGDQWGERAILYPTMKENGGWWIN